jgi:hypothetical protein
MTVEIRSILQSQPVAVPPQLLQRYPELREFSANAVENEA